jgi:hypothetical protein
MARISYGPRVVPGVSAIRARNYSLRSTMQRIRGLWMDGRQPLPHRLTEGLLVIREELQVTRGMVRGLDAESF